MVLIDPELEPDRKAPAKAREPRQRVPAPPTRIPPQSSAGRAKATAERLPAAGSLSRYLNGAQKAVRLRGEVNVLLTTDLAIRRLNRQFRGKNKATDVLSFPADPLIAKQEKLAGDLAISVDTARQQAAACGHSLAIEIKVLMLHGLLHLAGYDHETDNGQMHRRESKLRAALGLPLGLIERATQPVKKAAARKEQGLSRTAKTKRSKPAIARSRRP
jgi:probable rRNA maturation factor